MKSSEWRQTKDSNGNRVKNIYERYVDGKQNKKQFCILVINRGHAKRQYADNNEHIIRDLRIAITTRDKFIDELRQRSAAKVPDRWHQKTFSDMINTLVADGVLTKHITKNNKNGYTYTSTNRGITGRQVFRLIEYFGRLRLNRLSDCDILSFITSTTCSSTSTGTRWRGSCGQRLCGTRGKAIEFPMDLYGRGSDALPPQNRPRCQRVARPQITLSHY